MTQAFAANHWLHLGATPDVLNIGLPLYGRSFTLQDPSVAGVNAPAKAAGKAGRFTQEDGYLAFYEVTYLLIYLLTYLPTVTVEVVLSIQYRLITGCIVLYWFHD